MVISLSNNNVMNIKFIVKAMIVSIWSMIAVLSSSAWSRQLEEKHVKTMSFISEKFEMEQGMVVNRNLWNVKFPEGHIAIKNFDAELVDEEGNSVPLHETYLHHFFFIRYYQNMTYLSEHPESLSDSMQGKRILRNAGSCDGFTLPSYWAFGAESRGTSSKSPEPFAIEVGNPTELPNEHKEQWMISIMAIDTRGVQDRKGCTECRCDVYNITKGYLDSKIGIEGKPLTTAYKGGLFCCEDYGRCKLQQGLQAPKRKISLKYTIEYVDWDQQQVPLKIYVLDVVDQVKSNGSETIHHCLVEYTILENKDSNSHYDIRKAKIPMKKGGSLIYGTAHVHSGVVNATLYGQDGKVLCATTPKYGTGNKPGNEEGYVVGMSACYPKPGSINIADGETLTIEFVYENGFRTGAMGHFYIHLAEKLP